MGESILLAKTENREVVRVPVDRIIIQELTREELNILKRGESGTYLNIAIALLSLSIPLFITYFTQTEGMADLAKGSYFVLAVLFAVGGLIFCYLSWKGKSDVKEVIARIEKRYNELELQKKKDEFST